MSTTADRRPDRDAVHLAPHPPGFLLHVDTAAWRAHLDARAVDYGPGLAPVAKGNGYGVGNARLVSEAARLGVDTVCTGTDWELDDVLAGWVGDVLVLTPWHSATTGPRPLATADARVVRTAAHLDPLSVLLEAGVRTVVELRSSMARHGFPPEDLPRVAQLLSGRSDLLAGWALHLPIARPDGADPLAEAEQAVARVRATGARVDVLWVSHLSATEVRTLEARLGDVRVRPRIGTDLWLGDRTALRASGTVLDVVPLARGQRAGYRQRRSSGGSLVVVSGGTAHGVALEAPRALSGATTRVKLLAQSALAAGNRVLSPFTWAGKRRWFYEPPHMQVSLLHLPADVAPPAIGVELECQVRLTTVHPDAVLDA